MAQRSSTQPLRGQAAGSAARQPAPSSRRRVVRRQAVVRRIDPWSVLKLSLIFYFFLLLVGMLGLVVLWGLVVRLGVIEQALAFLETLNFEVELNIGNIARAVFLLGVLQVILLSGVNVFLAFLYNLVADLLGGLKVTLAEEERVRDPRAGGDGHGQGQEEAPRRSQGASRSSQSPTSVPPASGGRR
jgi:hypothetical protein